MLSRRDLGKMTLVTLATSAMAARKINSVVHGIQFGLQTYIFTRIGLPQQGLVDAVIASMIDSGLGECDFYAQLVDPATAVPQYKIIRQKFDDAGIEIHGTSGYRVTNEEDLQRAFEVADVLGAKLITLTVTLAVAKQIAPLVEKSPFRLGIQGSPSMNPANPETIARPEQYEEAVAISPRYGMSFDIGDATGSGYDTLPFVERHLDRFDLIYLKDRRKDHTSVPWGEGDTPVAQVLRMVRDRRPSLRCYVDCDYKTSNRPDDVKQSFDYAKRALS